MSKITSGLPLVGLLDVNSVDEGGIANVRLEAGDKGELLVLGYYDREDVMVDSWNLNLVQSRGRPVLVGVVWCGYQ